MFKNKFWITVWLILFSLLPLKSLGVDFTGYYWIDNQEPERFTNNNFRAATYGVKDGLHSLSVVVYSDGSGFSSPVNTMFYKNSFNNPATTYECYYYLDGQFLEKVPLSVTGNNTISASVDMSKVPVGLHYLEAICISDSGISTDIKGTLFYRTLSASDGSHIIYYVDDKEAGSQAINTTTELQTLELDMESVSPGDHNLEVIVITDSGLVSESAVATFKRTVPAIAVESVTLDIKELSLHIDESQKLTATVLPENATDKTLTWSSDNEDIAKVDETGMVTGISEGTANVTVACGEMSDTCVVTVEPENVDPPFIPVTSITLSTNEITFEGYGTYTLQTTVLPENATDKTITWSSDNEQVATVSQKGKVTSKGIGQATITAKAGDVEVTCIVEVVSWDPPVDVLPDLSGVWTFEQEYLGNKVVYPELRLTGTSSESASYRATGFYGIIEFSMTVFKDRTANIVLSSVQGYKGYFYGVFNRDFTSISGDSYVSETPSWAVPPEEFEGLWCLFRDKPIPERQLILNHSELSLLIGESIQLVGDIQPEWNEADSIEFSSNNNDVATVDKDGFVTGVSEGTAIITARSQELTAICSVIVSKVNASSIQLNKNELTLTVGQEETLTVTLKPENVTDNTLSWESDNKGIAIVDSEGKVSAISVGTATITVRCGDVSDSCMVTVNPVEASSVTLDRNEISLFIGESDVLKATVIPENTTDPTLYWESSDRTIATVDSEGKVTAISVGTATITARCGDVSDSCIVTVKPVEASSVTLDRNELSLFIGDSEVLKATVVPENTTDPTVIWSSDNENIVAVDSRGKVTAISVGTAVVEARCGNASDRCVVTVVDDDTDPISITTSDQDMVVRDGDQVSLWVSVHGGDLSGWTYKWTNMDTGAVLSTSNSLDLIAENKNTAPLTTVYALNVENRSGNILNYSREVFFSVEVWSNPILPDGNVGSGGIEISATKIRQDSELTLSMNNISGGYDNLWIYEWSQSGAVIGDEPQITVPAEMESGMANSNEKMISSRQYQLRLTNFGPDGTLWYDFNLTSPSVNIYRRPHTPVQLLRKGNGASCMLIVMTDLTDGILANLGYNFVYGYTDASGRMNILTTTTQRYCHTDASIYNDSANRFWVYAFWNYEDGSSVSSGIRYLDGSADESFDASLFDGSNPQGGMRSGSSVSIYTMEGHYVGSDFDRLAPGVYIMHTVCGDIVTSTKILKD